MAELSGKDRLTKLEADLAALRVLVSTYTSKVDGFGESRKANRDEIKGLKESLQALEGRVEYVVDEWKRDMDRIRKADVRGVLGG